MAIAEKRAETKITG